jgi:hypothetical protein
MLMEFMERHAARKNIHPSILDRESGKKIKKLLNGIANLEFLCSLKVKLRYICNIYIIIYYLCNKIGSKSNAVMESKSGGVVREVRSQGHGLFSFNLL